MEICGYLVRTCVLMYMILSGILIAGMLSGESVAFTTAITKKNMRGALNETKIEELVVRTNNDAPIATEKTTFPPPDDEIFDKMIAKGALRSADQQRKFLAQKSRLPDLFDAKARFKAQPGEYAAIIISKAFAFLHIWKCGGTSMAALTGDDQLNLQHKQIQNRKWVAFVRDPIDRFLSAWAECGFRQYNGELKFGGFEVHSALNWIDDHYDFRVRAFLHEVRDFTYPDIWMSCHTHAQPQANFMINGNGRIDPHISMVGELEEMETVVEIAGFHMRTNATKGRDASANTYKSEFFPARRDLLDAHTTLQLCEFLALDYFLFDFEPPEICVAEGGPLASYI